MYTRSKLFLDCHIAGFTFCDGLDVIDELKIGAAVTLEAETDNPHDPDAVAIYYEDCKIGYIPAYKNADICQLIAFGHGDIFDARISNVCLDRHPEQQFRISVRVKDKS